jgi:hypothetical protein
MILMSPAVILLERLTALTLFLLLCRLGSRIEDCNSWRADLQTELDNNIRSVRQKS